MPLYSTEAQNYALGKRRNEAETISGAEGEICAETEKPLSWCYMFVHHMKVETVKGILQKRHYTVFVHKSIVYKRENKHIKKTVKPTISGLLFVQGDGNEIQAFLKETFTDIYLVKDCSKRQIAAIPDSIMQPFMKVSMACPTRIRFMPHPIDYYSEGNPLIRITSGALAGLEGYRIRISRDKCLVTTLEGMTVAIGGIYKENFENLDAYVHIRREQLRQTEKRTNAIFTPLQQEIDSCFFVPQDQMDIMAMAESLKPWVARMKSDMRGKNFDEAVEIAMFLLEETGNRFRTAYNKDDICNMDDIMTISCEADKILVAVLDNVDVSVDLKEIVEAGRESLAIRYSFLPIEL